MGLSDRLKNAVQALLGVSAYEAPPPGTTIPEETVKRIRQSMGGNIQGLPATRLRWYPEDLETAMREADNGDIRLAAQLCRSMNQDGVYRGLLRQRTKGLVRLPKRFYGDEGIAGDLRADNGSRSVFDEMHPPSELQLLDGDGIKLGIGVAELVPVAGRDYPVMVRLQPENLRFRWNENRWYFSGLAGAEPILPGQGRWVLHVPGGRQHPWEGGDWYALGNAFIAKQHAKLYRANYAAKLANPARILQAPIGATEPQRIGMFKKLLAWGVNSVFELPVGWEAKLLESNGRGWDVFRAQIEQSDLEFMITLAGQIVTTTGGKGFDGAEEAKSIRQDLIQSDGDDLAYTLNTQTVPTFIVGRYTEDALQRGSAMRWDTGTPTDKEKETRILGQAADALSKLNAALVPYDRSVSVEEFHERFGIPTQEGAKRAEELVAKQGGEGGGFVGRPKE
jgi:hypothetical protein